MASPRKAVALLSGVCLSGLFLGGCIYYTQPAPQVVTTTNPPSDYNSPAGVDATPPQDTVAYQPPSPDVAPIYQDELAPYGDWVVSPTYGRCWRPRGVVYGWQPYTVGHWVYGDDGNCYWVSEADEVAWGPTVYHYGQWVLTSDYGWIWVPGTTYAPAWVAWRDGGGYCGWAPLPPEACYDGTVTYVVANRYCPPDRFVYVQEGFIDGTRVDQRIIRNNPAIIRSTTNITRITIVNNHAVNDGVSPAEIERRTGRQVVRTKVVEASSPEEARRLVAEGHPVHYTTPAIEQVHARTEVKVQHDQQVGEQHQQQLQLPGQQQKPRDQQAQQDQARQADEQKRVAHQQQLDQQKQAHDQQIEAQKQAAADKATEHQRQVEADKQAAADKATADRQTERDRQIQAHHDQQGQQNQQGKGGNGEKSGGKQKGKQEQNPNNPPPQ